MCPGPHARDINGLGVGRTFRWLSIFHKLDLAGITAPTRRKYVGGSGR